VIASATVAKTGERIAEHARQYGLSGVRATDLDVFGHTFDEAAAHPAISARQKGIAGLNATCRRCSVVRGCGGGLYAHRCRSRAGFDNPSVYCGDLEKIITHIRAHARPAVPTAARRQRARSLPDDEFDALAAGYGDCTAITRLIEAERSIPRTLLRLLRERADGPGNEFFRAGWRVFVALEKDTSNRPALNESLSHPYVRPWAEQCLRPGLQADDRSLANGEPGRDISAAARPAFGAVGAALPASGEVVALLLIHEFQHVKLGAILDLYDLYEQIPGQRFHVLWRNDRRPIEPVIQGTCAHIGVTDYWRVRRDQVDGAAGTEATEQFARWRMATSDAIETLASSGALTRLGDRFVARMHITIEPWLEEPIPVDVVAAAQRWATARTMNSSHAAEVGP
jgi:hypothetical protein